MKELKVKVAKDLAVFKKVEGNRPLNPKNVKALVKSIKEFGMLINPILVNKDFQVIDGQHRLEAAKQAKSPIYYILAPDYGMSQVIALNVNQKNWTINDYVKSYSDMGLKDYMILEKFTQQHKEFSLVISASLLASTNKNSSSSFESIRSGDYKVTSITRANEWAKKIKSIAPYFQHYNTRHFVLAIIKLLKTKKDVFIFEEFVKKVKRNPTALVRCVNVSDYIQLIEEIYNFKRRTKVNLRY